jgi:hypothetical protein
MAALLLSNELTRQMLKEELIWQAQQACDLQQDQVTFATFSSLYLAKLDCAPLGCYC